MVRISNHAFGIEKALRFAMTTCIAVFAFAAASAHADERSADGLTAKDYTGPYLKRPALLVSDLEQSLVVYRDILGFSVNKRSTLGSPDKTNIFKVGKSVKRRMATLDSGDEQLRSVALIEVKGQDLPKPTGHPHMVGWVVRVHDLKDVFEKVTALGLETTSPVFEMDPGFSYWEAAFVDPDGHLIVIYQVVPDGSDGLTSEGYAGPFFKRPALVVKDLDTSFKLYRDVLGFTPNAVGEPVSDPKRFSFRVFNFDGTAKRRFVSLNSGDEQLRSLAFFEIKNQKLPKPKKPYIGATLVRVKDIRNVYKKATELGLKGVEPWYTEDPEFDYWEAAIYDFDGHVVILYEVVAKS